MVHVIDNVDFHTPPHFVQLLCVCARYCNLANGLVFSLFPIFVLLFFVDRHPS